MLSTQIQNVQKRHFPAPPAMHCVVPGSSPQHWDHPSCELSIPPRENFPLGLSTQSFPKALNSLKVWNKTLSHNLSTPGAKAPKPVNINRSGHLWSSDRFLSWSRSLTHVNPHKHSSRAELGSGRADTRRWAARLPIAHAVEHEGCLLNAKRSSLPFILCASIPRHGLQINSAPKTSATRGLRAPGTTKNQTASNDVHNKPDLPAGQATQAGEDFVRKQFQVR